MKNHSQNGMGPICTMKANRAESSESVNVKIELVHNKGGHRNYLVNRQFVSVFQNGIERTFRCFCAQSKAGGKCEHLELVGIEDRQRFPDVAEIAVAAPIEVKEAITKSLPARALRNSVVHKFESNIQRVMREQMERQAETAVKPKREHWLEFDADIERFPIAA